MKLKDFLRLISDDDARIELQLDLDNEDEYFYSHFWLSDYLLNSPDARKYENWIVQSISFEPLIEEKATILIQINNHYV